MTLFTEQLELLEHAAPMALSGRVVEVRGLALRVADLPAPIGATVTIHSSSTSFKAQAPVLHGEVVGFDHDLTIVMPLSATVGVRRGDAVTAGQFVQSVNVGPSLLGRVLNGLGQPIDRKGPLLDTVRRPLAPAPVDPLDRPLIDQPLATGVRAVDTMTTVGRGQRIGVFASPGLGKSTLLGMMAQHTAADVCVIALIGERGREVRDFIENQLGPRGLAHSVVVCATSDESALLRLRAAMLACSVAEYFRDRGKDVLLIMDSVTRFCHAQRQVGLAAGEPPATKGYPPSVFAMLPMLLERSGRTSRGSITGLYAVLVEGDDMSEPIADAARSVLDGHVLLSHELATRGHWPAIDVCASISRVAGDCTDNDHQAARLQVLKLVAAYQQVQDLVNIGAYAAGANPEADLAIACKPAIDAFLQQGRSEQGTGDFDRTRRQLLALATQINTARAQLSARPTQRVPQGPRAAARPTTPNNSVRTAPAARQPAQARR